MPLSRLVFNSMKVTHPPFFQRIEDFQGLIGYQFKELGYLKAALTHSSFRAEEIETEMRIAGENFFGSDAFPAPDKYPEQYKRLEFLGDTVLNATVSEYLIKKFPTLNSGELSEKKHILVSNEACFQYGLCLHLDKEVMVGKSVLATNDPKTFKSVLADTFEALLGAITLDTQASAASSLFRKKLGVVVESILANPLINWKGRLQECVQHQGRLPEYKISEQSGSFKATVYCKYEGCRIEASAKAKTSKKAKQSAAKNALMQIKARAVESERLSRILPLCLEGEKTVAIAKIVICDTHVHDERRGRWHKCVIALNDGRIWMQFLPGEDILGFCLQLPDWRIVVDKITFAFMVASIIPTRDLNQLREDGPKLLQDYANKAWPLDAPEDGSLASDLPPETPEDGSLASDMPPETSEDGSLASDMPPDHQSRNCLIV